MPLICKKRPNCLPKIYICYYVFICNFVEIISNTFFSNRDTFLCFLYKFSFSSVGVLQNLFLNLILLCVAFGNPLVIKGAWLRLKNFFLEARGVATGGEVEGPWPPT